METSAAKRLEAVFQSSHVLIAGLSCKMSHNSTYNIFKWNGEEESRWHTGLLSDTANDFS